MNSPSITSVTLIFPRSQDPVMENAIRQSFIPDGHIDTGVIFYVEPDPQLHQIVYKVVEQDRGTKGRLQLIGAGNEESTMTLFNPRVTNVLERTHLFHVTVESGPEGTP